MSSTGSNRVNDGPLAMTKAKRLTPKPDTLRQIFLKSGNLCAFPKCACLYDERRRRFYRSDLSHRGS